MEGLLNMYIVSGFHADFVACVVMKNEQENIHGCHVNEVPLFGEKLFCRYFR